MIPPHAPRPGIPQAVVGGGHLDRRGRGLLHPLPLLAAQLTRDPLPVSLVSFATWLPWLVFGLVSGALVDRWDRRRTMWRVDAFRFAVAGVPGVAVLAGWASIPLLAALGFLLGTGQTLFDNAAQSLVPAIVSRDGGRLERANSQLYGAQTVTQNFIGPPAGGALFALAPWCRSWSTRCPTARAPR